ncbi:Diaminopimelate decarboxylase [compost metagenome]
MNDLLRPALYDAFHGVQPLHPRADDATEYDIVGPVCETADWLARKRLLAIRQGDVLAVESAGAYGMTMASNYNTRGRPAEVMVDGDRHYVVRQRETLNDLLRGESMLP